MDRIRVLRHCNGLDLANQRDRFLLAFDPDVVVSVLVASNLHLAHPLLGVCSAVAAAYLEAFWLHVIGGRKRFTALLEVVPALVLASSL